MDQAVIEWLLASDEPWTRYRTLVDLLGQPPDDPDVRAARMEMVTHPLVRELVLKTTSWPGKALSRHNDASHPIYALGTLADFGLRADDPGMNKALERVLAHQSDEGAFETQLRIAPALGGDDETTWGWITCDAPTLLYVLLSCGLSEDGRVQRAVDHVAGMAHDNGWRCACSPELGRFHGPGRIGDPCPIANVYALKALSLLPRRVDSPATRLGVETLLDHWEHQGETRYYLFGIGSDFRKLKYPFVWYDILHVADTLSRFPFAAGDARLVGMVEAIARQADDDGRFTAGSMYQSWKGWSFADKKQPSPWLTYLAWRVRRRVAVTHA